jgi:predicted MPP superfamily phosphohydrolase
MPTGTIQDKMTAEYYLLADLIDFNKKYANYVQCSKTGDNLTNSQGLTCSADDKNIQTVNDAYNSIMDAQTGSVAKFKDITLTNAITPQQYDASYNYITSTYNNDVLKLRSELDAKMKELYATPDSRIYEYKASYDTTMYVTILWTILATSGLYFVFTKL